jgi:D-threo-aldose 1-dehydrogenase
MLQAAVMLQAPLMLQPASQLNACKLGRNEVAQMNDKTGDAVGRRRKIGRTALEVTALSLGTAPLGGLYHELPEETAIATVDAAWQAGIRFFDTAPHYGHTKAEHRLGDALRRYPRADYVLSTKVGRRFVPRVHPYDGSEGWANPLPFEAIYDYSYDGILRSFEDSQQRLGIVGIDIVLIHDIGRVTHGEKNAFYWRQLTEDGGFRALDELRKTRGVKAVGLGVNEGGAIMEAMAEFDIDCALLAGRYTLLEQAVLDDLLPQCEKRGVSLLLGGAFNSGILARGLGAHAEGDLKFNYGDAPAAIVEQVGKLERVCREHGVALASAALQFPYAHKVIATVLMGARNAHEVQQNAASFAEPLPAALWDALRANGLLHPSAPVPQ